MKKAYIFLLIVAVFSCNTEKGTVDSMVVRPDGIRAGANDEQNFSNEKWGQFLYQHLKYYAVTVDPLTYVTEDIRPSFKAQVDSLKRSKNYDYNLAFDKALAAKKINANQHQAVKKYIGDLIDYKVGGRDKKAVQDWCLQKEQEIKDRVDLNFAEKDYILSVQSMFRYYLKNKSEDLADETLDLKKGSGRLRADGCDDLCPLNVIGTFVGLGSALGGVVGAAVLFGTAVVALIADPNLCSCTTNSCTYVRGISTEDVCYNSSNGLKFKTFGYGNPQPADLVWYFYRDNLKSTPDVIKSSGLSGLAFDEMILTDAEIGGASQIAIKVLSNCGGTYLNSTHFGWYVPSNFGKPRFVIYNLDGYNPTTGRIGQNSYFGITGSNYVPVTWSVSSMYATVLQNNQYGANFIVQWHNPTGTATVSASASTPCGSDTKSLSIQTVQ